MTGSCATTIKAAVIERAGGMQTNGGTNGEVHIDENLHSRQLAVYGRESMRRMASSKILVSGMQGLGAEVAKNVILAGVRACTIHDDKPAELKVRVVYMMVFPPGSCTTDASAYLSTCRRFWGPGSFLFLVQFSYPPSREPLTVSRITTLRRPIGSTVFHRRTWAASSI